MSTILDLFTSNLEKTKNHYSEKSSNLLKVTTKKRLSRYLNEVKKKGKIVIPEETYLTDIESLPDQTVSSIKRHSDEFSVDVKRRREDNNKQQHELSKMSANCQENSKSMKSYQKKFSELANALDTQNGS